MSAQTRAPLHAAHRRVDRDQHQQPARHRRRRATYRGPSSNPRARRHRPSAHPARNRSEQRESMAAELCLARYVLLRSFTSLFLHPICTPFFFQTIVVSTLLIHSSFSYTKSPPSRYQVRSRIWQRPILVQQNIRRPGSGKTGESRYLSYAGYD